ncbi:MAG: nucleoside diphosphate kinase regulator [Planctomycetota bacterium]|nr:MAG: nucleoside diphosphate kinase regulator [Planctomycetota bacterium]
MFMKPLCITEQDHRSLQVLIDASREQPNGQRRYSDALQSEITRARIVDGSSVPRDVVTMNSRVRLRDLDTGETEVYTLVYPRMADPGENRISILAPVGTAILGCSIGDVIEWPVPAGVRRLLVDDILYQPEKAGDAAL